LGSRKKGLNSLVILGAWTFFFDPMGAWTLWKHCNQCVFDGASPSLATALSQAEEERAVWDKRDYLFDGPTPRGIPVWTARSSPFLFPVCT
jgi:hypothetical protein